MRITRRSEITIDTHQVTVIRSGRARAVYCDGCGAEVRSYSDEQMAEMLAIGVDAMTDISRPQIAALLQLSTTEMSAESDKDRKE